MHCATAIYGAGLPGFGCGNEGQGTVQTGHLGAKPMLSGVSIASATLPSGLNTMTCQNRRKQ